MPKVILAKMLSLKSWYQSTLLDQYDHHLQELCNSASPTTIPRIMNGSAFAQYARGLKLDNTSLVSFTSESVNYRVCKETTVLVMCESQIFVRIFATKASKYRSSNEIFWMESTISKKYFFQRCENIRFHQLQKIKHKIEKLRSL